MTARRWPTTSCSRRPRGTRRPPPCRDRARDRPPPPRSRRRVPGWLRLPGQSSHTGCWNRHLHALGVVVGAAGFAVVVGCAVALGLLGATDGDDDSAIHGDDVNRAFGRCSSSWLRGGRHGAGWWSATCRVVVMVTPACGRARARPDPVFSRRAGAAAVAAAGLRWTVLASGGLHQASASYSTLRACCAAGR